MFLTLLGPPPALADRPTRTPLPTLTRTRLPTRTLRVPRTPIQIPSPRTRRPTHPPVPTCSPTATLTPEPVGYVDPFEVCAGDCDGSGFVTIEEVIHAVQIALGAADGSGCVGADVDGDGAVHVSELMSMVGVSLRGCATPFEPIGTGGRASRGIFSLIRESPLVFTSRQQLDEFVDANDGFGSGFPPVDFDQSVLVLLLTFGSDATFEPVSAAYRTRDSIELVAKKNQLGYRETSRCFGHGLRSALYQLVLLPRSDEFSEIRASVVTEIDYCECWDPPAG